MNSKNQIILFFAFFLIPVFALAQSGVSVSGLTRDRKSKVPLQYVSIVIKTKKDSSFFGGTITNQEGRFTLSGIKNGSYLLEAVLAGYVKHQQEIVVGTLSAYLDLGYIELTEDIKQLNDVTVSSSTVSYTHLTLPTN